MWDEPLAVSIVVPAFNEGARLTERAALLIEAAKMGDIDPKTCELIVVDDGSTDDTAQVAELILAPVYPRLRILQLRTNSGKGAAIRVGTAAAAAPIVAFIDADMSVDPAQIPLLLRAMERADVAIGSRSMSDSTVEAHSRHRIVMGRTFNLIANAFTNVGLKDTQCGFKAFRTPVARILFHLMVVDRFAFDVEVLCLARRLGMQIAEVPVEWSEKGQSTVRPIADSISMALDVARIRWRKQRPYISALVVGADTATDGHATRARSLSAAAPAFRKTDPILHLPQQKALILLPLCKADEIDGAASRLSLHSERLTVHKRLISCHQLMQMMPLSLAIGDTLNVTDGGSDRSAPRERRLLSHASGEVRSYSRAHSGSMSRLEA